MKININLYFYDSENNPTITTTNLLPSLKKLLNQNSLHDSQISIQLNYIYKFSNMTNNFQNYLASIKQLSKNTCKLTDEEKKDYLHSLEFKMGNLVNMFLSFIVKEYLIDLEFQMRNLLAIFLSFSVKEKNCLEAYNLYKEWKTNMLNLIEEMKVNCKISENLIDFCSDEYNERKTENALNYNFPLYLLHPET